MRSASEDKRDIFEAIMGNRELKYDENVRTRAFKTRIFRIRMVIRSPLHGTYKAGFIHFAFAMRIYDSASLTKSGILRVARSGAEAGGENGQGTIILCEPPREPD